MIVVRVLDAAIGLYELTLVLYIIMSWFAMGGVGPAIQLYNILATVCEPYIGIFRRIVPGLRTGGVGLDFSPLIAWLVLEYVIRGLLLHQVIAPLLAG